MNLKTLLPLLLFIGVVYGEQCCIEDSFSAALVIQNNYSSAAYYKVSYAATTGTLISFSEKISDGFFLDAGESKTILYNITLPFKGNYSVSFNIADSKSKVVEEFHDFEVINCHSAKVEILADDGNYCQRQDIPYKVVINNTGRFVEELSVKINADNFNITLLPSESMEYPLYYYSATETAGKVSASISNENISEISAEKLFNLRNCESTALAIPNLKACQGFTIESSIALKNLGLTNDSYRVINYSNSIISIDTELIAASSKETIEIPFILEIPCDEKGLNSAYVNILSFNSGLITAKITYEAVNCYDFMIKKETLDDYCEGDNKSMKYTVTNNGLMPGSFIANITFGESTSFYDFNLRVNESRVFTISEEFDYFGSALAQIIVSSKNTCEKSKELADDLIINSFNECYSGKLDVWEIFTKSSKVKITNNGSRSNNYNLSLFNYSVIENMNFSLKPMESIEYQLNNLDLIMNDYGISSFSINLAGKGVNATRTTSYTNSITGMITLAAKEYYPFIGLALLMVLSFIFIKKNILKQ